MKKILIVDDREDSLILLKERLSMEGFEVIQASSAREAGKKAKAEKPSLILLDVVMPDMSGITLCAELTKNPATSGIPVILITALHDPRDIEAGFKAGAFDYIKKPFDKIELMARVRSALRYKETQSIIVEVEKANTFTATVVTTNHKIKQPLTLINLCSTSIKREVSKSKINKEYVDRKISEIETAVKNITGILNRLGEIEHPQFADYLRDIKMIDIGQEKNQENNKGK